MRQKLTEDEGQLLSIRVHVSRVVGRFTLQELSERWEISIATLHRYASSEYRELSREAARRQNELMKKRPKDRCYLCKKGLSTHQRCEDCGILMHNDMFVTCDSCTRARKARSFIHH